MSVNIVKKFTRKRLDLKTTSRTSTKTKKEKSIPVLNAIRLICENILFLRISKFTKEFHFHVTSVIIQQAESAIYGRITRAPMKNSRYLIVTHVITKAKGEIFSAISKQNMDQNDSPVTPVITPQQGRYF